MKMTHESSRSKDLVSITQLYKINWSKFKVIWQERTKMLKGK